MNGRINAKKKVWVYRNLGLPGVWYSVMQNGRVVAHRRRLLLEGVKFVVRQAGRVKVLREKRKNVHAFVTGFVAVGGACGIDSNGRNLPMRVRYNPYEAGHFQSPTGRKIDGAAAALLNASGVTVAYAF
jgi:hypothetical protein